MKQLENENARISISKLIAAMHYTLIAHKLAILDCEVAQLYVLRTFILHIHMHILSTVFAKKHI